MNHRFFACPFCGKVAIIPIPSDYEPNRMCGPHGEAMFYMVELVPKEEEKKK